MNLRYLSGLAAAAVLLACAPLAQAAGLLVADGGFGGQLEIREHAVRVTVNNGIAVTDVEQVFFNTEDRVVEALYTFPVPANASVANFSMWINDVEMIGEVIEKERAREIYESYKQQRKDPGLLEQVDYRTFEMRIFPIAAQSEQRVHLTYYQELDHDDDWATFVYPLATTARGGVDSRVAGRFALTLLARSEIPIVEMESPSHADDFVVSPHSDAFYEASLEAPSGSLAQDVVLAYRIARPRTGIDMITSRQNGEDGYFCLMVTVGEELSGANDGMDYIFVLDISGSMAAERKLDTSSNVVTAFLDVLSDEDRFDIVAFNTQPYRCFEQLTAPDETAQTRARDFLGDQRPKGGTVLQAAIRTAYSYAQISADRQLNVVILSDGLTEQRDRPALLQLIGQRPSNVRVFCVGVGNDINRPLLEQLAEDTGGLAAMVSRSDNFERQARAFRRKLTSPVATDLEITFPGADVYDIEPAELPNLYHGTPVRLYGRYRGSGEFPVQLRANVAGRGLDQDVELAFPADDDQNPEIERMWAWHKMQELLKAADRTGARDSVVSEIVRLGEGYSIASEYTSFLVLENNEEFEAWQIERRNALRIERDRRAQQRLRDQLESMRDASLDRVRPVDIANATPEEQEAAAPVPSVEVSPDGQSVNFNLPGAGAIDPVSGALAAALLGLGALAKRRAKTK
ncbi:MAG: VWA domain-containing protein [Candidatus Hydrogenedentes bacterium]|nr:VWA domain-containing protein [Candidatus Hydrogenedentota bacterium]